MNTENTPPAFRAFYRKLLKFYPRSFRERFGESMEQTFDDLCREQEGHPRRLLSLTVHLSIDTGVGIVKEHVLHLSQRRAMVAILKNPKFTALIGVLLILPGALIISSAMFGFDAPVRFLDGYLKPADPDAPDLIGSLLFLILVLLLPAIGLNINVAATEGGAARRVSSNLAAAAVLGFVPVVPLILLELNYGQASYSRFPVGLFAILLILSSTFFLTLIPIVKNVLAGKGLFANPITLLLSIAFMVMVGAFWGGLVHDQMPCFLGVPNCD